MRKTIKVGDRVRLIGVPPYTDLATRSIFEKSLGYDFAVTAIDENGYVELGVEAITGTTGETIVVAPSYLETV